MATLVLAATATPARIVSCGQYCGRLSGGWVIHAYKATGKKQCVILMQIMAGRDFFSDLALVHQLENQRTQSWKFPPHELAQLFQYVHLTAFDCWKVLGELQANVSTI